MEECEKNVDRHSELKHLFLARDVTGDVFLDTLLEWDQQEVTRNAALDNIKLLESAEISEKLVGSQEELKYFDLLGFFYFHKGQIEESADRDGLDDFRQALEYSKKGKVYDDGGDWQRYVESTIAYLEGDLEKLKSSFKLDDCNGALLQNFVVGLSARGTPDYLTDYSKPRN